jgi:phage-related protein
VAIQVGSVEVDVIPNTQGIYSRLRAGLVPAATRAGDDAGQAAGRSFGPAMQREVGGIGLAIGQQIGQQIATRITAEIRGAMRDGVNQGGAQARASAVRQGDQTGGAFSRAMKTRLEAAFRSLPKINIDANTSEADADLQALRVRMETLANKRIGIDIDAGAAKAEIKLIEAELRRLGSSHPNIQVRADTATALGELAAVRAAMAAVDGNRVRVDVDTSGALSAILQLGVAIAGLAAIPAIPVLAAGIGSIASAGVAAGAGVGALAAVAIPAFVGIAGALTAQKAAQDAATSSSLKGAQASGQGAAKAMQMAGAQQALATAERNGARQIAQAQQQVRQAKTAAADAIVQAAHRNAQAARAIRDAERALARSQQDAKRAQEDLTRARREARQELEDLNARLAGANLSQRDAALGVKEAQAQLNEVMAAGSKASQLDKDRAQLAYDQAVQRLKEQTTETKRLKSETASANKAGVEGSDTVRSAQDRLAQAQEQVADRTRAVRDAQAEAARTQVETARQVAQAQERVGEATANVAVAQQSAADAVASAQRQIASASQSAAGGVDQAAIAQAKYQAALAKLTPAARGTFNAFLSLRTAFKAWSESLQPAVMPLFTRALNGIKNALPGLTPFVLGAAKAIGILQDRASAGFKSPWWKEFKADLAGAVVPAIVGLGSSFGRIFKGMAGIVQAFLPHMDSISATMQRITGRFANWGTSLKGSPQFERFLAYASKQGPILARALGDIGNAFYQIAKASAPLSGPVLAALGAVASAIASIAETLPWLIQLFYAAWIATKLWTLAMIVFNLVMSANPITLIIIGIIALVAAVIYAYKNFGWFRDIVQAVWSGIQTAVSYAWNNILKPVFTGIWTALQTIGKWATWLWQNILSPVFNFIAAAAKILLTVVVVLVLLPIIAIFKILGAIAKWLWNNAIGPAFRAIAAAGVWLWNNALKPAFNSVMAQLRAVAAVGQWLWRNVLSPVFTFIGDKGRWLWNNAIKPAFDSFKLGIQNLADKGRWLWDKVLRPVFTFIGDKGKWLWDKALKPAFDNIKKGVKAVGDSFESARKFIKAAWDKVQGIAKAPVKFIIDKVYNHGIVPTWNLVAKAFGAPKISEMSLKGWATGGVLPGYTPGRDVHRFTSPTGGGLELSGGEAIMRPEWTRAVGPRFVSAMNRIASSRGATGVKAALAPALGGNPLPSQQFADGGIFGWIGKTASGLGSKAWEGVKDAAGWLKDSVEASARAGVKNVVDPILRLFPGGSGDFGTMIRKIPTRILDSIFGFSKEADKKGAGGLGGPRIQAGLKWAKTQAGLPYQWGGNGNPSWDCSGFVSAIESVIRGQKPHRRWATGSFSGKTAPPGWVLNGKSPYTIGITNAGVGHTAGTINKVNVETRGGDGVVVGKRARGAQAMDFTHVYGFQPGKYDAGGYLQPGLNLAYNGTGRPEPVFTSQQANGLARMAVQPGGLQPGDALTLVVGDREFNAYVDSRAQGQVHATLRPLAAAARAGRKG